MQVPNKGTATDKIKELSSLAFSSLLIEGQRTNATVKENQKYVNPSTYRGMALAKILLPGSSFMSWG